MTKNVTKKDKKTTVVKMHNLKNPIQITMDLEQELRGYKYYKIMREHNGEISLITPELSEDRKRITFMSDKFSRYAIAAGNETVKTIPGTKYITTGGGDKVITDSSLNSKNSVKHLENAGEAKWPVAGAHKGEGPGGFKEWLADLIKSPVFPWILLLILILLAAGGYFYVRRRGKTAAAKDDDDDFIGFIQ